MWPSWACRSTAGSPTGRGRASAPGTSASRPGCCARTTRRRGLTSRELLTILRSLARLNLVGADIVEVAPAYDHAQVTGIAAAHAGYELLSAMAPRQPATARHET